MQFEIRTTDNTNTNHEMGIYLQGVDDPSGFVASYDEGYDDNGNLCVMLTIYDCAVASVYRKGTVPVTMRETMRAFEECVRACSPDLITYYEGDYRPRKNTMTNGFIKTVCLY